MDADSFDVQCVQENEEEDSDDDFQPSSKYSASKLTPILSPDTLFCLMHRMRCFTG